MREGRRTDKDLVTREPRSEGFLVHPDKGPVDSVRGRVRGGAVDGVGVEDATDVSLLRVGDALGGPAVQVVECADGVPRALRFLSGPLRCPGDGVRISIAVGQPLRQPHDLALLRSDVAVEGADPLHYSGGAFLVGPAADGDDALMVGGGFGERETLGGAGGAGYVATREGEEDVTVVAEAEVGADGALEPRLLEQGDGDTGVRGKEVAEFSDIVIEERVEGRELGAGAVRIHLPLTDSNGDVREAGVGEDGSLDVVGRSLDVGELEIRRGNTDDDDELAEGLLLFLVGKGEARDDVELHLLLLKVCLDLLGNVGPAGLDRMGVGDGAHLPEVWRSVGTARALGPGRAGLVNKRGLADHAVGIGEGSRVVGGVTGPLGGIGSLAGDAFRGGHVQALLEELWVDVDVEVRHWGGTVGNEGRSKGKS